jgi:hypothetical protein
VCIHVWGRSWHDAYRYIFKFCVRHVYQGFACWELDKTLAQVQQEVKKYNQRQARHAQKQRQARHAQGATRTARAPLGTVTIVSPATTTAASASSHTDSCAAVEAACEPGRQLASHDDSDAATTMSAANAPTESAVEAAWKRGNKGKATGNKRKRKVEQEAQGAADLQEKQLYKRLKPGYAVKPSKLKGKVEQVRGDRRIRDHEDPERFERKDAVAEEPGARIRKVRADAQARLDIRKMEEALAMLDEPGAEWDESGEDTAMATTPATPTTTTATPTTTTTDLSYPATRYPGSRYTGPVQADNIFRSPVGHHAEAVRKAEEERVRVEALRGYRGCYAMDSGAGQ